MKCIILAAGDGDRLLSNIPKTLLKISKDKTVLDFQLERLSKVLDLKDVIIVVGFKKEMIMKSYPELNYVVNTEFMKTNTSYSALLGLKQVDDDFIILNADVYFDDGILEKLIKNGNCCNLVNSKRCENTAVKYSLDENGTISKLSASLTNYEGESLGISFFEKKLGNLLKKELEVTDPTMYDCHAMQNLIEKNLLKLMPVNVEELFCSDIDFQSDLEVIQRHILDNQTPLN